MKNKTARLWLICIAFTVLMSVLGPYNLNGISPVVLAVLLAGAMEQTAFGFVSVLGYLLVGLVLPVYPGGGKGLGFLFGNYGGYLLSLLLCVLAVLYATHALKKDPLLSALIGFGASFILYFGIGMVWYLISSETPFVDAMQKLGVPCIFFLADTLAAFLLLAAFPRAKRKSA